MCWFLFFFTAYKKGQKGKKEASEQKRKDKEKKNGTDENDKSRDEEEDEHMDDEQEGENEGEEEDVENWKAGLFYLVSPSWFLSTIANDGSFHFSSGTGDEVWTNLWYTEYASLCDLNNCGNIPAELLWIQQGIFQEKLHIIWIQFSYNTVVSIVF